MSASVGPVSGEGDRPFPSGTVTFVFTDIEGSTQRWERDRAAMQDAVRRHDAVMRASIAAHGGYIFKTIGDAFCAAFHRPEDAVAAAADVQRALAAEDFRAVDGLAARVAIHSGTADERDGDYFGPAVNRVARVLAIGHGGQVLISGVTADLVVADLPPQATMRDLGQHRLKDLERPEQVYQLVLRDLRTDFPALRSLDRLPNNLPVQLSSFVGRDEVVAELTGLVRANRLVTLVGSGGVGKTRVSLQVAADLLDGSGGGVWFVELAPVADGAGIPAAIAAALGITLSGTDPLRELLAALDKRMLLVLDNCEHVVDDAARVAAAVVQRAPKVHVLASSRQPLGIDGEVPYRMPSLAVPDENVLVTVEDTRRFGALALFEERARVVDRRFALTDANVAIVAEIVRKLDGIPLAIELAAARIAILSPQHLRQRLDERLRLLSGGNRTALPRQQTLRALIDWSYDLLSERERTLFERLGVFVGSPTMEAVTAICSGDGLDEFDVLDLLGTLVDKSLVTTEADDHATRYRLLESMRVYALERLEKRGERRALATRHLAYYLALARECATEFERSDRESDFARVASELDNVRVALDRSLEPGGDAIGGAELATFPVFGYAESYQRMRAFSHVDFEGEPAIAARFWTAFAPMLSNFGDTPAGRAATERALELARELGDSRVLFGALYQRLQLLEEGSSELEAALFAELDRLVAASPPTAAQRTRISWIYAYRDMLAGRLAEAINGFERYEAEQNAKGNRRNAATLVNLAECYDAMGNTERAIEIARKNRERRERDRQPIGVALCDTQICTFLTSLDRFDEAYETGRNVASLRASNSFDVFVYQVVVPIALVYAHRDELERAAVLAGYGDATLGRIELPEWHTVPRLRGRLERELGGLDRAVRTALANRGAALSAEEVLALAFPDGSAT